MGIGLNVSSILRRALHIVYSFILAISSIAIVYIPSCGLMLILTLYALNGESDLNNVIAFTILIALSVYPAAWSMRLLMRVFPFRANGQKRWILIIIISTIVSVNMYLFWSSTYDFLAYNYEWRAVRQGEDGSGTLFFGTLVMLMTVPLTLSVAFPLVWAALQHLRGPKKQGLIYLRTFGAVGDVPIKRALLETIPKCTQIAFITSPSSMPSSWDLSVVALGGIKWHRPWSNIPIYLSSRNDTWVDDITSWIESDTIVAIDVTHSTVGLLKEIEIIESLNAVKRSVFLLNSGKPHRNTPLSNTSQIVPYNLSWLYSVPRIILLLVMDVAALLIAFYVWDDLIIALGLGFLCLLPSIFQPSVSTPALNSIRIAINSALAERKK